MRSQAPQLRPYQLAAVDAAEAALVTDRATLLAMAVGTGKSWLIAELARRAAERGERVLLLAHRQELHEQNMGKLRTLGCNPELEKAESHASRDALIVAASIQTLQGRRLESWPRDHFGLILVDEAHRILSESYAAVLAHFGRAKVCGLTGTPSRTDGQALGDIFDSCAATYSLRDAIKDGWLCKLDGRRVIVEAIEIDKVRKVRGDLDAEDLGAQFCQPAAVNEVVDAFTELSEGRRSIIFASTVSHAHLLAAELDRREPGQSVALDGTTGRSERTEALTRFREGDIRTLLCRDLFLEGLDVPQISCVAMARPTQSRIVYEQAIGRGTRLAPGKSDCRVIDLTANSRRHKLASLVNVLGGSETDDVLARAEQFDGDPTEAIERARAELSTGRITAWASEIVDLFGFDMSARGDDPLGTTARQLEVLAKAGMSPPEDLGRKQASELIGAIIERRDRKLCTFKQSRLLARHGINAGAMTFDEASARIGQLAQRWKRRAS